MNTFLIFAATLSLSLSAPQFPQTVNNNVGGANCRTEVETVFEEVESETLNKVICETEFRDSCEVQVETVCRNVTTSGGQVTPGGPQVECRQVDRQQCVDSMTHKCGVEAVLKNVSYTETVCSMVSQDICEMETVGGETRPVPGSCASKKVEQCSPVTRFVEEFVNEEVCRDIPIKDCRTVQEEVCSEVDTVCEDIEIEKCEIVPHEECRQVVDKVPRMVSKKVTKVVCDDDDTKENMTLATDQEEEDHEEGVPSIQDILEIFGVNVSDNDVNIDDTFISEASTTSTTTQSSTSTTTTTTKTTTTTTTRKPSTRSPEFDTTTTVTPAVERRVDGSQIIFSDAAIDNRNKDLATRVYVGRVTSTSRPSIVREQLPNSQIFFPE